MIKTKQHNKTRKVIILDPIDGVWQWVAWNTFDKKITGLSTLESWAYVFNEHEFDEISSIIEYFQEIRGVTEYKIKEVETTTTHFKKQSNNGKT